MCDGEIELSDRAKSLWGKTNRVDDTEWLPLYVHMADSAAMAVRIWDTWVPYGTKSIISRDFGNDDDLARKLMIFLAGVHDIGKATPVFQAKPISFGPDAESLAWKPEQAGLPMIAGLRDTSHPTHPIAGQVILERYFSLVHKWGKRESRQYACVVGGHHGTPPDKSKLESARLGKTESGLDSEVWMTTQNELIEFIAGTVGIGDEEWKLLSKKRFSAQSAVLATGLVIIADWIASNSDADMFPLVRVHPLWDDDEPFGMTERKYDDIQSWSGLQRRAERAWACVQLPHAWKPANIPSSCQDLFSTRFRLPEGAQPRPVQEQAVRVARDTDALGLLIIEAPMGEGKTEAALAAAEILAQRTGRGGICVALPTMATTDAMFSRVHRWLDALPSCDSTDEKTVWLAHGKAKLNDDFQGIIAASRRHFSSVGQDDTDEPYSRKHGEISPETVVSDWMWGRKKGALANFLVCTVDQVLMGALQMKHVVLRQLAMANKVVIVDECHAYDAYMREYLKMALEWLGSTRTPVILLSATLPESQREEMAKAYLKGWRNSKLELPSEAKRGGIQELKRRQLAAKNEKVYVNEPKLVQERGISSVRKVSSAYPVLTYTSDTEIKHMDVKPSGRSMNMRCQIVDDSDEALISLLDRLLEDGGCVGVICDTVGRAQHAAKLLSDYFGSEYVKLTHSRFMDIDRMSNEAELRQLLGPDSTVGNGERPQRMIVVGTQVLEQSLDIDFDALVTDIAPVDLIMQRLGRVHRHRRGNNECDRPSLLREAACYIRGIAFWEKNEVPSADMDDQNSFAGPVQAMTWQSRRIRLVPNEDCTRVIGVVNCYGDAVTQYNTDGFEKMTAWRRSIPQQKKLGLPVPPHMPVTHDASKALWRGLEPILCVGDDGDFRPGIIRWLEEIRTEVLDSEEHVLNMVTIHAQGMTYGTQSSVFETGIDDKLSLSMVMFRHDYAGIAAVVDVVKSTDKAVTALTMFVRNLRSAAGDHSGKTQEIADQIRESAYADLDLLFRDRLANFDESQDPVTYSNAWLDEVHRLLLTMGRDYLSQSPVPVFEEHESGRFGVMSAALAQLLFRGSLNKELGRISD